MKYPPGMSAHLQSHPQTSNACLVECQPRAAWRCDGMNRGQGHCRVADEKKLCWLLPSALRSSPTPLFERLCVIQGNETRHAFVNERNPRGDSPDSGCLTLMCRSGTSFLDCA